MASDAGQATLESTLPDIVKVVLRDGRQVQQRVDVPKGDPQLPLTWDELVAKFRDCAAGILTDSQTEAAVQQIDQFEALPTLQQLMTNLTQTVHDEP